jgi:GNAT superfamily N-acetyltransferase
MQFPHIEVILAGSEDLEEVSQLFDLYRIFYDRSSDLVGARSFIQERFDRQDSQIFVASDRSQLVGFTQLYPSFSSVSMGKIWILNDLFVAESARKQGVAKLLMNAAAAFARETGAIRLSLSTQVTNTTAQSLYRSLGYSKNDDFYYYALTL